MAAFTALEAEDPEALGRYRIVARLGRGGMGRVYLGRSPSGRAVAVKAVRAELAEDPGFRRRFVREVEAARRVTGFFTAAVVDADPHAARPWLATAYVPGVPLDQAVHAHGPWPERSVLALGAALAEALDAIHRADVVHRDLKPANVLLAADGPRVIDFGISLAAEATALTQTGAFVGTPGFISPEHLTGRDVGPASDVFALGAVLAFAATGTGPFGDGAGAHAVNYRVVYEEPDLSQLPPALGVVARCLAKDPERRPTVPGLLEELVSVSGGARTAAFSTEADWLPEPVAAAIRARAASPVPDPAVTPAPGLPSAVERPEPPPAPSEPTPPAARRSIGLRVALAVLAGAVALATGTAIGRLTAEDDNPRDDPTVLDPAPGGENGPEQVRADWTFVTDGSVCSAPTVVGDTVYAGSSDGALYAVDAVTGEELWTHETGDWVCTTPAVADGTVYFGSDNGYVYAVDAASGEELWTHETGDWVRSSPAVADGTVYIGSDDGTLYALDAASGDERWVSEENGQVRSSPVVVDGAVYFGSSDFYINALDAATGESLWHHQTQGDVSASPTVTGGMLYAGSDDGSLYALDAATGDPEWTFTAEGPVNADATVADGTVYFGSDDGNLYAVDAATGETRWSFATRDWIRTRPAVHEGVVYFGSDNGYVYAADPATGEELWTFRTGDWVRSSPTIAHDRLYIGSNDDNLYALPLE